MKRMTLFIILVWVQVPIFSQMMERIEPVSPQVFQFLKYGEIPVSEYTGIPNISIPLYEIQLGKLKVPLNLTYHANGNKVSDEASWVGLGWDLQIGQIVQVAKDVNDIFTMEGYYYSVKKCLPDYFKNTSIYVFSDDDLETASTDFDWEDPYDFWLYVDYKIPYDGVYSSMSGNISHYDFLDGSGRIYDTEIDLFKANFLGHSFTFILDPDDYTPVILDKKGYVISNLRDGNHHLTGWEIIAPDGTIYKFTEISHTQSGVSLTRHSCIINTPLLSPTNFSYNTSPECAGNTWNDNYVWGISSITDVNGNSIVFNYSDLNTTFDISLNHVGSFRLFESQQTFGAYSQPNKPGPISYANDRGDFPPSIGSTRLDLDGSSNITTKTDFKILNNILFNGSSVNFFTTDRTDYSGAKKLDSIVINNGIKNIKSVKFNNSYFTSNYEGRGYDFYFKSLDELTTRLKLNSISIGEEVYTFKYNNTALPPKNSTATDYWGYYNGEINNLNDLPNLLTLTTLPASMISEVSNFASNHQAVLNYTKAGILEQITYPTKGYTTFEYSLNTCDNININTNTGEKEGLGLRIKSISNYNNNILQTKKQFTYEGGKSSVDFDFYKTYTERLVDEAQSTMCDKEYKKFTTFKIQNSNRNSPNIFGSGINVGYSKVTIEDIDSGGNVKTKTIKYFYNPVDLSCNDLEILDPYHHVYSFNTPDINLPALRHGLDRGLLQKEEIIDLETNLPIKDVVYTYSLCETSDIYYSAQNLYLGYYSQLGAGLLSCGNNNTCCWIDPYDDGTRYEYFGFYIFQGTESLLSTKTTTDYFSNGDKTIQQTYVYNEYNLVSAVTTNSDEQIIVENLYYPSTNPENYFTSSENQIISNFTNSGINRISEVIQTNKTNNGTITEIILRPYKVINNKLYPSEVRVGNSNLTPVKVLNFLFYDNVGNITEYIETDGVEKSFIWGYSNTYPITKAINADVTEIFFDGFEENSTWNNWYSMYDTPVYSEDKFHTGNKSLKITNNTTSEIFYYTPQFSRSSLVKKKYRASCWVYSTGPSADIFIYYYNGIKDYHYDGFASANTTVTNKWVYIETEIEVPETAYGVFARIDNNTNGTVYFDDIRICPVDAQMTTYTYDPLIGMTSETDPNGKATYYEYDSFGRLQYVKDYEGKVLKRYEYNYATQE